MPPSRRNPANRVAQEATPASRVVGKANPADGVAEFDDIAGLNDVAGLDDVAEAVRIDLAAADRASLDVLSLSHGMSPRLPVAA